MRIVFDEVAIRPSKSGKCACGIRRRRSTKIYQTVNPFNRNAAGLPKTRHEIIREVQAAAEKWRSEPITCANCRSVA